MSSTKVVTASFRTTRVAHEAVREMEAAGIPHHKMGALVSENSKEEFTKIEKHTKASEGAAIGGASGIALGALIAGLTAIAGFAVPGAGLAVAGPLVAALTGAGAGGAIGGVLGALAGLGVPEHEAKFHTAVLEEGGCVLVVQSDDPDDLKVAEEILGRLGENAETTTGRIARAK